MRYFNAQWDKLSMATHLSTYFMWNVTDKAATYNEELFKEAYKKMEEEWAGMREDPIEQEQFINQFFQSNLNEFEEIIPEQIKAHVADMRLLALGTVTSQVLDEIKEYSKQMKMQEEELYSEYKKHYQNAEKQMSKMAFKSINRTFHDSFILDCGYEGANVFFMLRMDGGWERLEEQYIKLIFKEATVPEGEISNELCHWIYEEFYCENGLIEVHIRFSGGNIIIQASDVYCEYYHSFFASDTSLREQKNEEVVCGKVKDLIVSGKIKREDTLKNPLRESMGDEAYENMNIIVTDDIDPFGKLAICQSPHKEEFSKVTGKKYIYEIKFGNDWDCNPGDMSMHWKRGEELLQYIRDYCEQELELWSVWSDSFEEVVKKEYQLEELRELDLEAIYDEKVGGIDKSRKIMIRKKCYIK